MTVTCQCSVLDLVPFIHLFTHTHTNLLSGDDKRLYIRHRVFVQNTRMCLVDFSSQGLLIPAVESATGRQPSAVHISGSASTARSCPRSCPYSACPYGSTDWCNSIKVIHLSQTQVYLWRVISALELQCDQFSLTSPSAHPIPQVLKTRSFLNKHPAH